MAQLIDLTGQCFGHWTALAPILSGRGLTRWRCRCDCGTEREVIGVHLRYGRSRSCGCAAPSPGEHFRRHNAKLTGEQVLAIRADTRSQAKIATAYGVKQPAICLIKKR